VHRDEETTARDLKRDAWLESRGYRVLRVTNDEVFANMASIIGRIEAFVRVDTPTPTPPRKGEGLYVGEE
jgi:very-short-patch-repair endonuclease